MMSPLFSSPSAEDNTTLPELLSTPLPEITDTDPPALLKLLVLPPDSVSDPAATSPEPLLMVTDPPLLDPDPYSTIKAPPAPDSDDPDLTVA